MFITNVTMPNTTGPTVLLTSSMAAPLHLIITAWDLKILECVT